ncbi:MAG: HAD family hydrolase [Dehalococcoidia bacterium]
MAIRAVLFDLDGTLWTMGGAAANADFDWSGVTAIQADALGPQFERLGFDCDPGGFVTRFFAELNATLSPPTADFSEPSWFPVLERVLAKLGCHCERWDAEVILDTLNAVPFSEFGITAFPDAAPVLTALSNGGFKLGAVTNNPKPPHVLGNLARDLGLPDVFDVIVSSWELGWRKPHRAPFETALRALQVDASEALHVGDSLENDIAPALELGMSAVLRRNGRSAARGTHREVDSLLELLPILTTAGGL